jgi:hypothetical protein
MTAAAGWPRSLVFGLAKARQVRSEPARGGAGDLVGPAALR